FYFRNANAQGSGHREAHSRVGATTRIRARRLVDVLSVTVVVDGNLDRRATGWRRATTGRSDDSRGCLRLVVVVGFGAIIQNLVEGALIDERQEVNEPTASRCGAIAPRVNAFSGSDAVIRRHLASGVLVAVHRQHELAQVVSTLDALRSGSYLLNRRQQQS